MDKTEFSEGFYERLKKQLHETSSWPTDYLYKFIVPSDLQKISLIEAVFNDMGAIIRTKSSAKGNYTSVSVHVQMKNPEAVVQKYEEIGEKVEGVISL